MNALFELFGQRVSVPRELTSKTVKNEDGTDRIVRLSSKESRANLEAYVDRLQEENPGLIYTICGLGIQYIDKEKLVESIDNSISWAVISYAPYYANEYTTTLRPNRTIDDIKKFIDELESIYYDNGYGTQCLYGNVVYKDGTWLERWEYDGSEGWSHKSCPAEPDWAELEKEMAEQDNDDDDASFYEDEIDQDEYDKYYQEEQDRNRDAQILDRILNEEDND